MEEFLALSGSALNKNQIDNINKAIKDLGLNLKGEFRIRYNYKGEPFVAGYVLKGEPREYATLVDYLV